MALAVIFGHLQNVNDNFQNERALNNVPSMDGRSKAFLRAATSGYDRALNASNPQNNGFNRDESLRINSVLHRDIHTVTAAMKDGRVSPAERKTIKRQLHQARALIAKLREQ
ncbi:MAG: hypothetical protein FJX76_05250 [Armatimonadetes bacterium]|nr:hypothetical protein [Armatimonadota bacterium]